MAHPQHREALDRFDAMSVVVYRSGLAVAAVGLGLAAWWLIADPLSRELPLGWAWWVVCAGCGLSVSSLHLYDKRIRWLVGALAWAGVLAVLCAAGGAPGRGLIGTFGLGLVFAALSALALKERFCFRLPLLWAVPALLAASTPLLLLHIDGAAGVLLAGASGLLGLLALAKLRMPLHYDIGDRSAYQV